VSQRGTQETPNAVIEAGGPEIFKRNDLSQLIQSVVRPEKKVRTLPIPLLRFFLPMIKSLDRNTFDKLSFFLRVMECDTVAPQAGVLRFHEYIQAHSGDTV
jgi:hypothetical protein